VKENTMLWLTIMALILCLTMLKGCDMCEQTNRLVIEAGGKRSRTMEGRDKFVLPEKEQKP